MEILSDATFKGNVIISGGGFYVTYPGNISPLMETLGGDGILIRGTETIYGSLSLGDPGDNANIISNWSDLGSKFAPSCISTTVSTLCTKVNSLSSTVSSHTTKINLACSTISSLCYTVNSHIEEISSLCVKLDSISKKHTFGNPPLPVGCTKFYFVDNFKHDEESSNNHYAFSTGSSDTPISLFKVFKFLKGELGNSNINEEVQMDIKQYGSGINWFEGTLASNTTGYKATEFIIVFDGFVHMCAATLPSESELPQVCAVCGVSS